MGEKTKIIGIGNLYLIKMLLFPGLRKGISRDVPLPGAIGSKPGRFFSLPDICSRLEDI